MPPRKDLGTILVEEDVLEQKDLERVRERRPLWKALVDGELATPDQIFRALSARFGVPVVSDERLAEVKVPDALKPALPPGEALLTGLLPVDLSPDGQRVTVVMVDPSDEQTLAEFLTRAGVPEGRALLGRRDAVLRAIQRCLADPTLTVTPLPPPRRRPSVPSMPAPPAAKPVGDDDVTGTVKLDPALQAEISRLPPRMTQADPLTPLPQKRPRRPTPTPAPPTERPAEPSSSSSSEALRAEERLSRALIETVEILAGELEARLVGNDGSSAEMARLSRRVARQLGLGRRAAEEIGVAAQLFALDRELRAVEGPASADVFSELGWAAAGDGGLVPVLQALTAASAGFSRALPGASMPVGARIVGAVADYLELGAASGAAPDLDTVSQLLRASPAGAQVVDALLRVLDAERGDKTPAQPTTLPATSMLKRAANDDDEEPTPPPTVVGDSDKTVRKAIPQKTSKGE